MFKTLLQHIHKTFIINLKWQVDSGRQKKKIIIIIIVTGLN